MSKTTSLGLSVPGTPFLHRFYVAFSAGSLCFMVCKQNSPTSDVTIAILFCPYVSLPQEDLLDSVHQNIHVSIKDVTIGTGKIQRVPIKLLSDRKVV